ncbi:MAG: tetratricopeptide repeat protein [Pseudomonadota bacterium]
MADDDEQLEAIKNWWNENGTSFVVTLVVAVAGIFGYQAWQNQQEASADQASVIYEDLVTAVVNDSPLQALSDDDISTGRFLAGRLQDEYGSTGYAQLGTLLLAKLSVEAGDLAGAEKELRWILDNGVDASLEPIVRLRLARVLLAQDQTDAAFDVVTALSEEGAFASSIAEVRGDIALAQGDERGAYDAYLRATEALPENSPRPLLEMKRDNLSPADVSVASEDS